MDARKHLACHGVASNKLLEAFDDRPFPPQAELIPPPPPPPPAAWSIEEQAACFTVRECQRPGACLHLFRGGAGAVITLLCRPICKNRGGNKLQFLRFHILLGSLYGVLSRAALIDHNLS